MEAVHYEKKFVIETENNSKYDIYLKSSNSSSISLEGNFKNNLKNENYLSVLSIEKIKENKYFLMFDTIDEILNEISLLLEKNNPKIIEEKDKIILKISLNTSKIKEVNFTLNKKEKNENEKISELYSLINNLTNKFEITINDLTTKINKQNNEINELKNIIKKQNETIKNLTNSLLFSLDSLIIGENDEQNNILKNWINPEENIKSKLLYRLTRDGNSPKTFHEKCDNQGPTLVLTKLKDGRILGGYTPLSWDSSSGQKYDLDSFLFSLTDNKKFPKINKEQSINCYSSYGPWFYSFGLDSSLSRNQLIICKTNKNYQNANEMANLHKKNDNYDITELEVFKIN